VRAFRGDRGELAKPTMTRNGFMRADAFFTRTGVFEYQNADGSVRRELRIPEEVFNPDSVSTFEMVPVTMGHPPRPVDTSNARRYGIGHTGQDVRRDGDKMRGTILIDDKEAISEMKAGRREISNGYFCQLEMSPGVTQGIEGVEDGLSYDCIQREIEGNHVAIVDRGRAGPDVAVRVDHMRCDGIEDIAFMVWHDGDDIVEDAPLTSSQREGLPDSSFLYIAPGGEKDEDGKTTPRSLRKFPVKKADGSLDLPRIRNALSRIPQSNLSEEIKSKLSSKAKMLLDESKSEDAEVVTTATQQPVDGTPTSTTPNVSFDEFASSAVVERGLSISTLAQALRTTENETEFILSGRTAPTGQQLDGLAGLFDVSAETLRNLLPDGQREDQKGLAMEDFEITINGVTFKAKADSAARQAITKKMDEDASAIADMTEKLDASTSGHDEELSKEKARADSAEEAKAQAEAKLDAALDPSAIRSRIDGRIELERAAGDILGEDFDVSKSDGELREAVILSVQPEAKLDEKPEAYIQARFDAALEIHSSAKTDTSKENEALGRARVVANDTINTSSGDIVADARAQAAERSRNMWKTPLAATKDAAPEQVRIKH